MPVIELRSKDINLMGEKIIKYVNRLTYAFFGILLLPVIYYYEPLLFNGNNETIEHTVIVETIVEITLPKGSIDPANGLIVDDNYILVEQNCSACHSLQLVTQNRASRAGWKDIIVWMQETQKLWDLGKNEPLILDYLSKNYANSKKGRRMNLQDIEWYEL
jgi:hypothetical protein